jgi:hypothetical protein
MRKRSLQPTRVTPDPRPRQKQQNRCSPEREREEAAVPEAIERLISRGPPAGSGIPFEAWRSWHRYGSLPVRPRSFGIPVPTIAAGWALIAASWMGH